MREDAPLISILTPCYNSEPFLARMLDSILLQTYPNIEVICINDGSTDKTSDIIQKYISVFNNNNKKLVYIEGEHQGQASAINKGLKKIRGDFFGLLDSDDYLTSDSLEKKVKALQNNLDFDVVSTDYYIVHESDLQSVIGSGNRYNKAFCNQPNQFLLLLQGYSTVTPLSYMIRTEAMRKINPDMEINECIEGQNFQILLPIYYRYKRMYIDEKLGFYVVRDNSHDHAKRTRVELMQRYENLLKMIDEVLSIEKIGKKEKERYLKLSVFNKYLEDL